MYVCMNVCIYVCMYICIIFNFLNILIKVLPAPRVDHQQIEEDEDENGDNSGSDDSKPLLLIARQQGSVSTMTTGIGAKVINSPVPPSVPTFPTTCEHQEMFLQQHLQDHLQLLESL